MSGFCCPPVTQVDICFPRIYKGEMERLFDCVWRVGGGQKSSACTEGKIYVPGFCFLPSLQPYPWPSLLIFHSTILKLLKRRPLLKFINEIKSLNGHGVVGRGEFFLFVLLPFFRARRGKVVMRHSFNFPPSSSSAPASVWTLFASSFGAAVLSRRGGWERSRLKAKLRCAVRRGSLLWTPARRSNDLVHLPRPSLFCHELRAKRAREQRDETALSNQPQGPERRHQRCFCAVRFFFFLLRSETHRTERCFLFFF